MRTVSHTLDRIGVVFDDERLVAHAGLIAPATLAQHLGLRELFDTHVDWDRRRAGRTSATRP